MSPISSNCEKYADINFDVQSNIFCCHKVKLMPFIFLNLITCSILAIYMKNEYNQTFI